MMKIGRRTFVASAGAGAALAASGWKTSVFAAGNGVPAARITGPIAVVAGSNEPYRGANEQPIAGPGLPPPALIPFGYVEEEYFISGEVNGQPYNTSLLVRKPKDAKKFSGLVAVETIHAAGAIPFWGSGQHTWMPGGHAWVAVASQLVALEQHSKKANPARYASLNIPVAPGQQQMGLGQPGSITGGAQARISEAIMAQVGVLLKSNAHNGPLSGARVRKIVMGGASQTGATTLGYILNAHAILRMANGASVYDGYFPADAFTDQPVPAMDVPVMHPCVEGDFFLFGGGLPKGARADSDTPKDRYVHYEIAGASHVVTRGGTDPLTLQMLNGALGPTEHASQFPNVPYYTSFMDNFVAWVMKDVAPPTAARIEIANGQIARDKFGNALGGLRSPYVDLPTVHYIASATPVPGSGPAGFARRLVGLQEPLTPDQLRSLYPSKAEYLRRFGAEIDEQVAGRWMRAADGEQLKKEETNNPALAALS